MNGGVMGWLAVISVGTSLVFGAENNLPAYQMDAGMPVSSAATGEFLRVSPVGIFKEAAAAGKGTLAARIAEEETSFRWRISPDWRRGAAGKWLSSPESAPDGSVVAVLERTGVRSGPWGTRLVFFELPGGKIIRERFLDPASIERIAFVGGDLIGALESAQEFVPGTANRLRLIDPVGGELRSVRLGERCTSIAFSGEEIWVSGGKSGKIFRFGAENLEPLPAIPGDRAVLVLRASPNGKDFFAATEKTLRKYEKDDSGQWMLAGETVFDSPKAVCEIALRKDGELAVIVADTQQLLFCRRGAKVAEPGGQIAGRTAAFDEQGNLYFATARNLAITILPEKSDGEVMILRPDRSKPRTLGEPVGLFPGKKALVVLDSFGYLYQFRKFRKKFVKELLFSPEP